MGRKPLILPVAVLSLKLSVYWLDLVTSVPRNVAHPLVHGLKHGLKEPVVVTDDRILELVEVDSLRSTKPSRKRSPKTERSLGFYRSPHLFGSGAGVYPWS